MASLFSSNRILPNLKRRARPTNKSEASPSKAKPLHILPNLAEEDEAPNRPSCSSVSSVPSASHHTRLPTSCATIGGRPTADQVIHIKRESRRVVLTGVEGLSFDDFFPPSSAPRVRTPSPPPVERTPSPPARSASSSPSSQSPLDDIDLRFSGLGISLDFPPPPLASVRTPSRSFSSSSRRELSPTPSSTSSDISSSYSSPKTPCTTPPTSDDESPYKSRLARAPTFKSQHASVIFMKSMPDLGEPVRKSSFASTVDDDSILEELEYIARDISEVISLSTPLPATFPTTPTASSIDARARPDSVMPAPRKQPGHSRISKPLPVVPRISIQDSSAHPSAQLDPTFPLKRRSYLVPTRPPPPPPMPKSPTTTMEQATEELLAELANAALGAGFMGTELVVPQDAYLSADSMPPTPSSQFIVRSPSPLRPPPRSSIPADIHDSGEESPVELMVRPELTVPQWPSTPQSISVYSQITDASPSTSPLSEFEFDIDVSHVLSHREEASAALEASRLHRTPSSSSMATHERTLRSRWSTSTLGSLADGSSHAPSWLPRFNLSPSKKGKGKSSSTPAPAPTAGAAPLQRKNAVKAGHGAKRSVDSDRGLTRRDSRASRMSESSASDSGESTMSNGLKRKPIPMALLATAAA